MDDHIESDKLKISGIYALVRNPMYSGWWIAFAGITFMWHNVWMLLLIQDAVVWHVIPVIIITVLAETVRTVFKYNWTGDVIATVIMTFSSFGYYGQIWFNRDYTYECAVEEMPWGVRL